MSIKSTLAEALAAVEMWDFRSVIVLINPADWAELVKELKDSDDLQLARVEPRPEWGLGSEYVGKVWEKSVIVAPGVKDGQPEVLPEAGYTMVAYIQWRKLHTRVSGLEGELREQKRRSRSRRRNDPPESFTWTYSWAVLVQGFSFDQVLSGQVQAQEEPESIEDKLKEYESNCRVSIEATKGYTWRAPLNVVPKEIADRQRAVLEEEAQERARVAALSPEEREAELQEILGELSGSPGFMMVQLPRRD